APPDAWLGPSERIGSGAARAAARSTAGRARTGPPGRRAGAPSATAAPRPAARSRVRPRIRWASGGARPTRARPLTRVTQDTQLRAASVHEHRKEATGG